MLSFSLKQKPHFILMVGDDAVLLVPFNVPHAPSSLFAALSDEKTIATLLSVVARDETIPVMLLADSLAQDFRRETLPALNLFDRPKLIKRRLQQAFPQARLTAYLNIKSSRSEILLVGLHEKNHLFDWLERLKFYRPTLALLPLEAVDMVTRLSPDSPNEWTLLLSRQRTGGFRQIVTYKGDLVFTRLTPPLQNEVSHDDLAEAITRDIKASLGYLSRLGLKDSTELNIILLVPELMQAALQFMPIPLKSLTLYSPHRAGIVLNLPLKIDRDEPCSDLLYAGWFAQKRKACLSLMLPEMQEARLTDQIKIWGQRIAIVALVGSLILTSWQAGDLVTTVFATHKEAQQVADLGARLKQKQAEAASVTAPLGRLRQAVERQRIFSERTIVPWESMQKLSQGLGDKARLDSLEWHKEAETTEVLRVKINLVKQQDEPPQDRQTLLDSFQQVIRNIKDRMQDSTVSLIDYPFHALPDATLSPETATGIENKNPTAELLIRKTGS